MLAWLLAGAVGGLLTFAAVVKAVDSGPFLEAVHSYRLLPERLIGWVAVPMVAVEGGLGVALMLAAAWPHAIAMALAMLVGLTAVALWGEWSGRVEDCGCYGGLLSLKPHQTAVINAGLVAMLVAALMLPPPAGPVPFAEMAAAAAAVVVGLAAWRSIGNPIFSFSPLVPGRPWPARMAGDMVPRHGDVAVLFASPSCEKCQAWLKALHILCRDDDFPYAVAMMPEAAPPAAIAMPRFTQVRLPGLKFRLAVTTIPQLFLLRDGVVVQVWRTALPPPWVARLRARMSSSASGE